MNDTRVEFIPFHAINEFMLPDYRLKILQEVFGSWNKLSDQRCAAINRLVKRLVTVPGFRNSTAAPPLVKARSATSAFERSPEMVAQICAAWCELHPELADKIYNLLKQRGWELLPIEADRSKILGFLPHWPKDDPFEVLDDAYAEVYPGDDAHEYDINMMIVWLSGRLPVEMVEMEKKPTEPNASTD